MADIKHIKELIEEIDLCRRLLKGMDNNIEYLFSNDVYKELKGEGLILKGKEEEDG